MSIEIRWHTDYAKDGGGRHPAPQWPEDWPVPRVGDQIALPNEDGHEVYDHWVHHVIWLPSGREGSNEEPFVYVVLHRYPTHRLSKHS